VRSKALTTRTASPVPVLVVDALSRTCTLPLAGVVETMRPLPVEPLAGAPPFVRGVAVVRGEPIPVVDLAYLLAGELSTAVGRFVVLRSGDRRIALAVEGVWGKRDLDSEALHSLPSLLGEARSDIVKAVALIDQRLLTCLEAGRLLFDESWQALDGAGNREDR